MDSQIVISKEETEIVNRVAKKFIRKMHWNPGWELEDIQQELLCFWIETKQKGWTAPENWQGAMGHCLNLHLTDLIKHACARKRQVEALSLDQMLGEGHDFSYQILPAVEFDFFRFLNQCELEICKLILEGKTKLEISSILKRSKSFINKRLFHVRKIAEEFPRI